MTRFYKSAAVTDSVDGFTVALDGRPLKTPSKLAFRLPTSALAVLCAEEWQAQGEKIDPETMPATRLANVAIDRAAGARQALVAEIAKYGETDLLCHRADHPPSLVARQAAAWNPLLAWAAQDLGAPLIAVTGIMPQAQPPASIAALAAAALALDDFRLTALAHAAGLAGSAVIALAASRGRLGDQEAFEAAALDDLFSMEIWGEDAEARKRLDRQRAEFQALSRFFAALG